MGEFKIVIDAIGGHGVDRGKMNGEVVDFTEGGLSTPDAIAAEFVQRLKDAGASVQAAGIIHWPGSGSQVTDNLLTGERTGSFQ